MSFFLRHISSLSVLIPAIICFIRFRKVDDAYLPFFLLVWAGLLNETVSITLSYTIRNNILSNNIWFPIEFSLAAWQFYRWRLFAKHKRLLQAIISLLGIIWLADGFFIEGITTRFSSYFLIASAYTIVLMSISMVNKLIVEEKDVLWKNPAFIICSGFILFYTVTVLTESFYQYGFNNFPELTSGVFRIFQNVNIITNLIYFVAVLWIPTRQKFILQS
jgi:hypothetical protein